MPTTVEKVEAKTAGALKGVKARVQGLTGVFKHLAQEHSEVSVLIRRVSSSSDEEVRGKLYPEIRRQLLAHEKGELMQVYPAFNQHPELRQIVSQHGQQAGQLEQLIGQLDRLPVGAPEWKATFDRLVERVEDHVDLEETQFFPAGQHLMGDDQAASLLERYEAQKQVILSELA
jgi:hypothetical protein